MKIVDKALHHDHEQGVRHRLARFFGLDFHRAPLPAARPAAKADRDPFPRNERRIHNRQRERSRAVGRKRGQVMRS